MNGTILSEAQIFWTGKLQYFNQLARSAHELYVLNVDSSVPRGNHLTEKPTQPFTCNNIEL